MTGGIAIPPRIRALAEAAGIQVNFCRTPTCANFGRPPLAIVKGRGSRAKNAYRRHGTKAGAPGLMCKACGRVAPIKSNLGIAEEVARIASYLDPPPVAAPACASPGCGNRGKTIMDHPEGYRRYGRTKGGSPRFQCKECRGTVSMRVRTTLRQRRPNSNVPIFLDLVNAKPICRTLETAQVSAPTFYDKLDFIWRQCRAYAGIQERRLCKLPIRRLYLSSDRQDYLVNWSSRVERAATQLGGIATADNITRFVFAINLDYDPVMDQEDLEAAALAAGDCGKLPPYRRHARFWLKEDYKSAAKEERASVESTVKSLALDIEQIETAALARPDAEAPPIEDARKLPGRGLQVRPEYVMYAHFQLLRRLAAGAEKVRFYLDVDPALRGACLGVP